MTAKHIKASITEAQCIRRTQVKAWNIDEAGTLAEMDATW